MGGIRCVTGSLSHLAAALPSIRPDRDFTDSGRDAVVVIQHAAQALAPLDYTGFSKMAHFWANEPVGQALVISLGVVVGDEILNGRPQRILSEQDPMTIRFEWEMSRPRPLSPASGA